MLYTPKKFHCSHIKLEKTKISESIYKCENCGREFRMLPVKHDPILMPHIKEPGPRQPFKEPKFPKSSLDRYSC